MPRRGLAWPRAASPRPPQRPPHRRRLHERRNPDLHPRRHRPDLCGQSADLLRRRLVFLRRGLRRRLRRLDGLLLELRLVLLQLLELRLLLLQLLELWRRLRRRLRRVRLLTPDTRPAGRLLWPLRLDGQGGLERRRDNEELHQALDRILSTAPGERLGAPEEGCGLHELVDLPDDDVLLALATFHVERTLLRALPELHRPEVTITRQRPGEFAILIRAELPPADASAAPTFEHRWIWRRDGL